MKWAFSNNLLGNTVRLTNASDGQHSALKSFLLMETYVRFLYLSYIL